MPTSLLPRGRHSRAFNLLKTLLVGTIITFAIAAGYMAFLIIDRQASLSKVSHYDIAWTASQGANEYIRLLQRVTALAEAPSRPLQDEVNLRFEILKGRLTLFKSGDFGSFISETEERQIIVARLSSVVGQLNGLMDRLENPVVPQRIMALMEPLESDLIGLASEAAHFSSVNISDYEQELSKLHRNFSMIALGFLCCAFAFIALLAWHNRLLTRAHLQLRAAHRDLQEASSDLAHMARHDQLTGLPNRLLLQETWNSEFGSLGGNARSPAIMCLDLDNFKNVNDTLGHSTGDALLKAVVSRVTDIIGQSGLVARFGGDEFVIFFQDIHTETAAELAASLVDAIAKPFYLDGDHVVVGASIGIAVASDDDDADPGNMLRNADLALFRAKHDGRGTYRFFEPEMDACLQRRRQVERELQSADFDNDFELHFQPLVDLRTKKVCTFEVLLRWSGRRDGAISPDEFIPVAEDCGLIVPLGAWVLKRACTVAKALPPDIRIAVNLSAAQFRRSNIVETIAEALSETGLAPDRLELEITESLLLDDSKDVLQALRQLRSLGILVSLDDFGTGYSSLAYLRKFTVDKVKIDRSFISGIDEQPDHLAIVQAIVGLSHALGMRVVAEGIETEEQLLLINASGCNQAQGYLFSRPLPLNSLEEFLTRRDWIRKVA